MGRKDLRGIQTSNIIVGATMGIALLVATFAILGPWAGTLGTLYLIYEGYTLVNKHPEDTISESVWRLATRPIVPLLFGIAAGWALANNLLNPYASFAVGILYGHFFFQRQVQPEAVAEMVEKVADPVNANVKFDQEAGT